MEEQINKKINGGEGGMATILRTAGSFFEVSTHSEKMRFSQL